MYVVPCVHSYVVAISYVRNVRRQNIHIIYVCVSIDNHIIKYHSHNLILIPIPILIHVPILNHVPIPIYSIRRVLYHSIALSLFNTNHFSFYLYA